MTHVKPDSAPQHERAVDDALNDALIATFPASDPVSIVNTLISGTRGQQSTPADNEANAGLPGRPSELVTNAKRQSNLANAVAFLLVLFAVLLMLDARSTYPVDLATAERTEGIVAVPPM